MQGRHGDSPAVALKGGAVAAGTNTMASRLNLKRVMGGEAGTADATVSYVA